MERPHFQQQHWWEIKIDRVVGFGSQALLNESGTFTNVAKITIAPPTSCAALTPTFALLW
ncbi:MAG: hypothetical protein ACKVUS_12890 [Saprospiraceae bacterium]